MTPRLTVDRLDKLNEKLANVWPRRWPSGFDGYGFTGFKGRQQDRIIYGQILADSDQWQNVAFDLGRVINEPDQVIFEKACEAILAEMQIKHGGVWLGRGYYAE